MTLQVTYKYRQLKPDPEQRRTEGSKTIKSHPSKVPVVIGKASGSGLPELDGYKFLFPASSKVSDVMEWINQKLKRPHNASLYLYVDNEIVIAPDSPLSRVYQEYRDSDYFLYIAYYELLIHRTNN